MQDPDKRAGRDEAEHSGGGLAQQLEEEGRRRDSGLRQRNPVRGIFQTKYFPLLLLKFLSRKYNILRKNSSRKRLISEFLSMLLSHGLALIVYVRHN